MKRSPIRIAAGIALAATASVVSAQSSFTIVRPYDGARVREKVKILVPKASVPSSGYIGVFLDGKLLDAAQPELDPTKNYYQYTLDTKGRQIADGAKKLELKLYVDYNGTPRIVDTSSVDITVANSSGIKIPGGGISLRYKWTQGTERIYTYRQRNIIAAATSDRLDARATSIEQEGEGIRLLYAVDATYGDGAAMLRMQVVPNRGTKNSEYAYLTVSGATAPARFFPKEMSPIYMRVDGTGREKAPTTPMDPTKQATGSIPPYFPLDSTSSSDASGSKLYAAFPLPVLPAKPVKPGDTWPTAFLRGAIDLSDLNGQKSVVQKYPARGEFVSVEWEMGHPCAKIRNSIAQGASALNRPKDASGKAIEGDKVQVEETIYFALDTREVIKVIRDETIESKVQSAGGFQGGSGGNSSGGRGGPPSGSGRPGGPPRGGGGSSSGSGDFSTGPDQGGSTDNFQRGPSGSGAQGSNSAGSGRPGGYGPGGYPGAGGQAQATYYRTRRQQIFILVK